jgi:hypothetical protein
MSQTSTQTTTSWKESLSEFEHYQLLSSVRRRLTVAVLCEEDPPTTLDAIAEAVARREFGDDADDTDVERVAATLHHIHLPTLEDYGAVDYDPQSHIVQTA